MRTRFDAKEKIREFNEIKNACKTFTWEIMKIRLRNAGIPGNSHFLAEMMSSGMVMRNPDESYSFTSDKPVHYSRLQNLYEDYRKRLLGMRRPRKDLIEEAIELLKSEGYVIFRKM